MELEVEQQKGRRLVGPSVVLEVGDVEGQFRRRLLIDAAQVFGHSYESLEGVGQRAVRAPVGIVQDVGGPSVQMDGSDQRRKWLGIVVAAMAFFGRRHSNLDLAVFQGDKAAGAERDNPVEEVDG